MKRLGSIENKIVPAIFFAGLLLFWQFIVDSGYIKKFILPSPYDVAVTLVNILPDIKTHIFVTLEEAMAGFIISIFLAIALALLMDSIKLIKRALNPLLVVSQTIPIIALAPLFVIWFGFGILPKIIVVILVCFFPIVVSLSDGLESVDKDMINLLKSMGARRIQIFKLVKFPSAIVSFFSGLRIAATYSIMGAVIGEWVGGSEGLGVYMIRVKHSYALDKMFAAIVVIVLLSMLLFKLITVLEYFAAPWNRKIKKET